MADNFPEFAASQTAGWSVDSDRAVKDKKAEEAKRENELAMLFAAVLANAVEFQTKHPHERYKPTEAEAQHIKQSGFSVEDVQKIAEVAAKDPENVKPVLAAYIKAAGYADVPHAVDKMYAALYMTCFAEGTLRNGGIGWYVKFGGKEEKHDFHPGTKQSWAGGSTSAYGAIQLMQKTDADLQRQGLPAAMTPAAQTAKFCALWGKHALGLLMEGKVKEAVVDRNGVWASFPTERDDGKSRYAKQTARYTKDMLYHYEQVYAKLEGQTAPTSLASTAHAPQATDTNLPKTASNAPVYNKLKTTVLSMMPTMKPKAKLEGDAPTA